jgi:2-C-methyl-D-erythritol 4-phosphate cytidylyltransferase
MKNAVIIVAGGAGKRMGYTVPKQFIIINDRPIILHTIDKFIEFDPGIEIIVVLAESYYETWQKLVTGSGFDFPVTIAAGGETRFHSVKSGLEQLKGDFLVGIHDSVRPFVTLPTIQLVFSTAELFGCAVPCVPLKESVREVHDEGSTPLDRSYIQIVQTPQVFRSDILRKSYETDYRTRFTDDASVVEAAGYPVRLVQGDEYNFKITSPEDLEIARMIINSQKPHLH